MKALLAVALSLTLAACGGGGSDEPEPVQAQKLTATDFVFIGNSLTYVPLNVGYIPEYQQWGLGGWGMAASAPEKDYVHLVSGALGLPYQAANYAALEMDASAVVPDWPVKPTTVVVVQLGDNGLPARYSEIIAKVRGGQKLVCLSTWGEGKTDRDAVMRPICEAAGGRWITISDLHFNNQDDRGRYTHGGVDGHPHDWSMNQIAQRILAVVK